MMFKCYLMVTFEISAGFSSQAWSVLTHHQPSDFLAIQSETPASLLIWIWMSVYRWMSEVDLAWPSEMPLGSSEAVGLTQNTEPDLQTLCRPGNLKTQMHRSTCTTVICCHFLVFSFQSVEIWAFWTDNCSDNRYTHQGRAAAGAPIVVIWWYWLFICCLRIVLGATCSCHADEITFTTYKK